MDLRAWKILEGAEIEQFEFVILYLARHIPQHDRLPNEPAKHETTSAFTTKSIWRLNRYRLSLATAYFYKKDERTHVREQ